MTTTPEVTSSLASSSPNVATIIYSSSAKFPLGQIVATPGALELLQETGFSAAALCRRHVQGDWGDLCDEDRAENDYAVTRRLRILSCYRLVDAERLAATSRDKRSSLPSVLVITEADRSVTTVLCRDEY
ncbi:MAG: type I restriction endonuclease subunit M [Acidovorax sp.]|uniref:type I restriction endonuclease subunit M n=1 Tax=Acidovorax sp. TaxID=1872122 RepID=UPI0022C4B54B|nr:type I restriction endonuclease subunit M [Acidovorax sp.]MCZ8218252.1 type I restriction endonuclease subunit M [Acidovorax sp.]